MSEDDARDDEAEGWQVPQRRAAIAVLAVPLILLGLLSMAGYLYDHALRPATRLHLTTFPAPGIETAMHDGLAQRETAVTRPQRDPKVAAAMAAVARDGLPGWEVRR